jgi:folate-dependent phosphoribosylglycinamide formyltransferase PurN
MTTPLSIVVVTGGGPLCLPILHRLLALPAVQVRGIVYDTETVQPRRGRMAALRRLLKYEGVRGTVRHAAARLRARPAAAAPHGDDERGALRALARDHGFRLEIVDDLNAAHARQLVRELGAQLGVVIGTRILTPAVFTIPPLGMINIHQGKIPFYRGGACAFWALYDGATELGVTVHKVVAAVDAGEILRQATLPLTYDYARYGTDYARYISDMQRPLNALSVDLMARAVDGLARGEAGWEPVDPAVGRRCRKPTFRQKQELVRILQRRYAS